MFNSKKEVDFTNGPILGLFLKFMVPILITLAIQSLYGAVDLMIVGQFGTAVNVSGVAVGGAITHTFQATITALAMGTTILLGQFIGEGKRKDAGDVVGTSIILFAAIAVVITVGLFAFTKPLLKLMNLPVEAMPEGMSYVRICSLGMIFIVSYNVMGSIFRGIGDSLTPLLSVSIACVVNIGGDLLLVGAFKMAAAGAAIATVLAQGISVLVSILIVRKKGLSFDFGRSNIKYKKEYALRIVKFGTPLAAQELVVGGSFLIMESIMNSLGLIASAGVGVAGKLVTFTMLFPLAAMQASAAFNAQNVGARKLYRAKKTFLHAMWLCIAFSVLMSILTFFNGTILTGIFTQDIAVKIAAADYLKPFAIDCFLCSFLFSFVGYMNGCGRTTINLIQSILGVLIRVAAAFLLRSVSESLFIIGLATPISTCFQIALCAIYFMVTNKQLMELYDSKFNPKLLTKS